MATSLLPMPEKRAKGAAPSPRASESVIAVPGRCRAVLETSSGPVGGLRVGGGGQVFRRAVQLAFGTIAGAKKIERELPSTGA